MLAHLKTMWKKKKLVKKKKKGGEEIGADERADGSAEGSTRCPLGAKKKKARSAGSHLTQLPVLNISFPQIDSRQYEMKN